jgi:hypothetical protein
MNSAVGHTTTMTPIPHHLTSSPDIDLDFRKLLASGWDRAALEADPNRLPPRSARRTSFGSVSPRQRGASS